MIETPSRYRLRQEADVVTKELDGSKRSGRVTQTVLEREEMPTDAELIAQLRYVDSIAAKAEAGYSRAWSSFKPTELRIEELRQTRLATVMAHIGLGRFIPYDIIEVVDRDGLLPEAK